MKECVVVANVSLTSRLIRQNSNNIISPRESRQFYKCTNTSCCYFFLLFNVMVINCDVFKFGRIIRGDVYSRWHI